MNTDESENTIDGVVEAIKDGKAVKGYQDGTLIKKYRPSNDKFVERSFLAGGSWLSMNEEEFITEVSSWVGKLVVVSREQDAFKGETSRIHTDQVLSLEVGERTVIGIEVYAGTEVRFEPVAGGAKWSVAVEAEGVRHQVLFHSFGVATNVLQETINDPDALREMNGVETYPLE